ncbi:MAG: hypothetical protein HZB66_02025 [Candidatus Aenigmarchaeota archaeon]|nr:hypothetical protein [Candidatus Aenigmarchaeota archaeon]
MSNRELPEHQEFIIKTCLAPYHLSEDAIDSVMIVCRDIYNSALDEGYSEGHKAMSEVHSRLREDLLNI